MHPRTGFLTFASDVKYLELACTAGLSLYEAYGSELTIVISEDLKSFPMEGIHFTRLKYPKLNVESRFEDEWQAIHCSPYEHTIKIDADMLFFKEWQVPWRALEQLADNDIGLVSGEAYTFRNERISSRHCRILFDENALQDVYSAMFYFDKSKDSWAFFKRVQEIFVDWQTERLRLVNPATRPHECSTDVAYAMALSDLGLCATAAPLLKFVHMKSELNFTNLHGQSVAEDWTKTINHHVSRDGSFFIENHKQNMPFHYHVKQVGRDYLCRQK